MPERDSLKRKGCETPESSSKDFSRISTATETIQPPLPIDEQVDRSDFEWYIQSGLPYIDKSLFIKKFFSSGAKSTVILRPRGFGKTLNMTMLKCFLDENQKNSRDLFEGLKIMKEDRIVDKHMGKHPVAFLSLKDCTADTWDGMRRQIWDSLYRMCEPHIRSYPGLGWDNLLHREYIKDDPRQFPEGINDFRLGNVFDNLVYRLKTITQKRVMVLIDDYDVARNVKFSSDEDNKARSEFFRDCFSVAEGNSAVERSLLTWVFEIRTGDIFTGSILVFKTFADEFFGFSEDEVKACLSLQKKDDLWDEVREYYGGYCVGECEVVNPFSFMNYLRNEFSLESHRPPENIFVYLREWGSRDKRILEAIQQLLSGTGRIWTGQPNRSHPEDFAYPTVERVLNYLCTTGYLTYRETSKTDPLNREGEVWIPNREVREVWEQVLADINRRRSDH